MHILLFLPCNNICPCPPHFRSHKESSFLWSTPHPGSAEEFDTHPPGMRSADKTPPVHLQDATITILRTKNVKLSHMKMVMPPINFLRFMFFFRPFGLDFPQNYFHRCVVCHACFPYTGYAIFQKELFYRSLHNSWQKCGFVRWHFKETFPYSRITWSLSGKENAQAKEVYSRRSLTLIDICPEMHMPTSISVMKCPMTVLVKFTITSGEKCGHYKRHKVTC